MLKGQCYPDNKASELTDLQTHEHRCMILKKILANPIQKKKKEGLHNHSQVAYISEMAHKLNNQKPIHIIYHINRIRD